MFDFNEFEKSLVFSLANIVVNSNYKIEFGKNEIALSVDKVHTKNLKIQNYKILESESDPNFPIVENAKILFYNIPVTDKIKNMFLQNVKPLESNSEGEVFLKDNDSKIYVNGFLVAVEKNFLFSYNIKTPSKNMIQKIENFELPFKRTAYVHKIKNILLNCENAETAMYLAKDLEKIDNGTAHDEINWKDVQLHAVKLLNVFKKYIFITKSDYVKFNHLVDIAIDNGYKPIFISKNIKDEIEYEKDLLGEKINTINSFFEKYSKNFQFNYIDKKH